MSIIKKLVKKKVYTPPHSFVAEPIYEVIMGSTAYGVSGDSSDVDVYAVCIPPKEMVFPTSAGYIPGFGKAPTNFEVTQQHHMMLGQKEYDVAIYSIINFFRLCADNNPNMIDSLFVPSECITSINNIGTIMRENRKLFLHKGAYNKFKGYAYGQLKKVRTKVPTGKRKENVDKIGYDSKFFYHIIRLLNECEQILMECDLNLRTSKEELKGIRRGDYTLEQLEQKFETKVVLLDELYLKSKLRLAPDMAHLKTILLTCLEEHFGSLDNLIDASNSTKALMFKIQVEKLLKEYS